MLLMLEKLYPAFPLFESVSRIKIWTSSFHIVPEILNLVQQKMCGLINLIICPAYLPGFVIFAATSPWLGLLFLVFNSDS